MALLRPLRSGVRLLAIRSVLCLGATVTVVATEAAAQGYRISDRLYSGGGFWKGVVASPDGSRIVFSFAVGSGSPQVYALSSVPVDGSQDPVQLSTGTPTYIFSAAISPDGARVVYEADQNNRNRFELFTVPIGGGEPVRLNNPGVMGADVGAFALSPDGSHVLYLHDFAQHGVLQLFSVPIDRSQNPLELSLPGGVNSFRSSPVGNRVVYRTAGPTTGSGNDLFSVPADRSLEPVRLNDPTAQASSIFEFQISADGARVVYSANQSASHRELFSVPIDRSQPPVRLSGPMVGNGNVYANYPAGSGGFAFAPGGRVVYLADQDIDEVYELYSVPIDGSAAPIRLDNAMVAGRTVFPFRIDAPANRVVFTADRDTDEVFELYSVPIDGSQLPVKVSGALVAGGSLGYVANAQLDLSPDGTCVAYVADQEIDELFELYVAPVDGSQPPTKVSGSLVAGGDVRAASLYGGFGELPARPFLWSADGQRLVYYVDQDVDETFELYSVRRDGSQPPLKLSPRLSAGASLFRPAGDVYGFQLSTDGSVLLTASVDGNGSLDLYRVPVDRSKPPLRVNDPLPRGQVMSQVLDGGFATDDHHVLYRCSGLEPGGATLLSVDLQGGVDNTRRLSGPFLQIPFFSQDVGVQADITLTPDGTSVLYRADQNAAGVAELYAAPIDGSSPSIRLNDPIGAVPLNLDQVLDYRIDPAGARAVYRVLEVASGETTLRSVPIDGSGSALKLDGITAPNRTVADYRVGSSRALFRADADSDDVFELYSAPLDGSQAAIKISAPLVAGGDVVDLELSADGQWAVYRADQELDERFELYAVPVDGSQAPVKRNSTLAAGGDVLDFRINASSTRVVYRADQAANDVVDLYSVPIDGSAAAVRLNLSRPLADVESDYALSHDGLGVAYRADQDTDGKRELYVAPIDGSFAPQKKSGALAGEVVEFQISPDDARLVYRGGTTAGIELFSVPIAGSSAPVRLNGPLVANGNVAPAFSSGTSFLVTPDGSRVVYVADQLVDTVVELFSVPIDGSAAPSKESGTLVNRGGVRSFLLDSAGKQVLYLADQDFDETVELYLGFLQPTPKSRRSR